MLMPPDETMHFVSVFLFDALPSSFWVLQFLTKHIIFVKSLSIFPDVCGGNGLIVLSRDPARCCMSIIQGYSFS